MACLIHSCILKSKLEAGYMCCVSTGEAENIMIMLISYRGEYITKITCLSQNEGVVLLP